MRVCIYSVRIIIALKTGKRKALSSRGSSSFDEGGENARMLRIKRKREKRDKNRYKSSQLLVGIIHSLWCSELKIQQFWFF